LFFLIEYILFLAETNNFSLGFLLKYLGFFFFIPAYFLFYFKGFLFENFRYLINLANIISLVLTNILSISNIFYIARSDILLFVFFIINTRNYISFSSFSYRVTKRNKTIVVIFR
jgi:hypothetical protein